MSYLVRFTAVARDDIERLFRFLAERNVQAAQRMLDTLHKAWQLLSDFPFTARKADPANPFFRELFIPFVGAGYVAMFEIDDPTCVTVLAIRHQREDDYH